MSSPRRRARENLTGIVSVLVTGIWMAALFLDFDWWLGFMLFGYIVLVPVTALLFGDESDVAEWWDDDVEGIEEETEASHSEADDALQQLRSRYARGELTDEQFERKLERLLETETLEDVEEGTRRSRETELDRE
ncbi:MULTISPECIES: SHOCT domain-containing protein [Salinibaculum]|uniref:SHOCT domain-containing protein n=1 Tax=Salinibaculum TaxID=2732368 RepID=UPI0030D15EF8